MKLYPIVYIFSLVLLLLFLRSSKADSVSSNGNKLPIINPCTFVNCNQGTCRETNSGLFFECDCYSGWTKFHHGSFVFPTCIIPNCTLNFGCGTGSPPPPPPLPLTPAPAPALPPPVDILDPCTYAWCGEPADGSCKRDGIVFECDCSDGSDNLLDNPLLPCFKECALGADCNGVQVAKPPNSPPADQASSSYGLRELGRASMMDHSLKILLILVTLFHQWI